MKICNRLGVLLCGVMVLLGGQAAAQSGMMATPNPALASAATNPANTSLFNPNAAQPAISTIPALSSLVAQGAKLFYMGERSGMPGWFIWLNGQVQMIYLSPDRQTAFMGAMFSNQGDNVTGEQVKYLSQNNRDFTELMNSVTAQQGNAGMPQMPNQAATPLPVLGNNLPAMPVTPGERLYQDLLGASHVTVGANPKAEILMVIDTNCPHCQATWKDMRDLVAANKIQVRLIPITTLEVSGEDIRTGAKLLEAANPYQAWDEYVKGNKDALGGQPNPEKSRAVLANRELIEKWKIKSTPYLVYRGKDGKVKLVSGKPDSMKTVINDLGG